jgi:hypothetical protein
MKRRIVRLYASNGKDEDTFLGFFTSAGPDSLLRKQAIERFWDDKLPKTEKPVVTFEDIED